MQTLGIMQVRISPLSPPRHMSAAARSYRRSPVPLALLPTTSSPLQRMHAGQAELGGAGLPAALHAQPTSLPAWPEPGTDSTHTTALRRSDSAHGLPVRFPGFLYAEAGDPENSRLVFTDPSNTTGAPAARQRCQRRGPQAMWPGPQAACQPARQLLRSGTEARFASPALPPARRVGRRRQGQPGHIRLRAPGPRGQQGEQPGHVPSTPGAGSVATRDCSRRREPWLDAPCCLAPASSHCNAVLLCPCFLASLCEAGLPAGGARRAGLGSRPCRTLSSHALLRLPCRLLCVAEVVAAPADTYQRHRGGRGSGRQD